MSRHTFCDIPKEVLAARMVLDNDRLATLSYFQFPPPKAYLKQLTRAMNCFKYLLKRRDLPGSQGLVNHAYCNTMCTGTRVLGKLRLVHDKTIIDSHIGMLHEIINQLKTWLVGSSFDDCFEDYVAPVPYPPDTAARERCAIYRNRGFLRHLATLEWLRCQDEREGTHVFESLQHHLRLLEEECDLPARNLGEKFTWSRICDWYGDWSRG